MQFLGCLFVLFLGIIFIITAFLGSILNAVFSFLGLKKPVTFTRGTQRPYGNTTGQGGRRQQQEEETEQDYRGGNSSGQYRGQQQPGGKIFQKDDSEYVDFEEI